jgi:hypothetical protein
MTATPNEEVSKQPEGLDFHNRRSSTCGYENQALRAVATPNKGNVVVTFFHSASKKYLAPKLPNKRFVGKFSTNGTSVFYSPVNFQQLTVKLPLRTKAGL